MSDTPRTDALCHEDNVLRIEDAIALCRDLEYELMVQRRLTDALGAAVQPFMKKVPLDKFKAVSDAYAALPEPTA